MLNSEHDAMSIPFPPVLVLSNSCQPPVEQPRRSTHCLYTLKLPTRTQLLATSPSTYQ
ncbi:hypothetical protein BDR03DRAFT_976117 [Suillus americanus]|nr:hypothetical protein BDR03DRAFT_976117 [Suillus americanus]